MTPLRGLYPIVDLDALARRDISALRFAEAVLTARPALLQLRAKHHSPRSVLDLLRELKPLCERAGTRLLANDRPDLALLAGADGVHVGQEDVPLCEVRRLPGSLLVGVSTHDHEQLAAALVEKPDYAAFGPVFATRSKQGADPALGLSALARAAELCRDAAVPLVAIGGLTLEVAPQLRSLGVVPAVISDLLANGDTPGAVADRADAWQRALA